MLLTCRQQSSSMKRQSMSVLLCSVIFTRSGNNGATFRPQRLTVGDGIIAKSGAWCMVLYDAEMKCTETPRTDDYACFLLALSGGSVRGEMCGLQKDH